MWMRRDTLTARQNDKGVCARTSNKTTSTMPMNRVHQPRQIHATASSFRSSISWGYREKERDSSCQSRILVLPDNPFHPSTRYLMVNSRRWFQELKIQEMLGRVQTWPGLSCCATNMSSKVFSPRSCHPSPDRSSRLDASHNCMDFVILSQGAGRPVMGGTV